MFTKRRAFTIVELLITFTLFTTVAMISVVVMLNVLKSTKRIRTQVFLYTEAQALMDHVMKDVQRNAIDYEAYYARNVQGDTGWALPNYGLYAQSFHHPGDSGGPVAVGPYPSITGYGTFCQDGFSTYPDDCPNETPISDSYDFDSGAHPFTNIDDFDPSFTDDPTFMNAMCESTSAGCGDAEHNLTDELLLVNAKGDQRIVILREQTDASGLDHRLAYVIMSGTDSDGNGIEDTWTCVSGFTCNGPDGGPNPWDLVNIEVNHNNFLPRSDINLDIQEFSVIISPTEDPFRAYAEPGSATQVQPQVTILMTVALADAYGAGILGGENLSVSIQRTISTGVYSEVKSYD